MLIRAWFVYVILCFQIHPILCKRYKNECTRSHLFFLSLLYSDILIKIDSSGDITRCKTIEERKNSREIKVDVEFWHISIYLFLLVGFFLRVFFKLYNSFIYQGITGKKSNYLNVYILIHHMFHKDREIFPPWIFMRLNYLFLQAR